MALGPSPMRWRHSVAFPLGDERAVAGEDLDLIAKVSDVHAPFAIDSYRARVLEAAFATWRSIRRSPLAEKGARGTELLNSPVPRVGNLHVALRV